MWTHQLFHTLYWINTNTHTDTHKWIIYLHEHINKYLPNDHSCLRPPGTQTLTHTLKSHTSSYPYVHPSTHPSVHTPHSHLQCTVYTHASPLHAHSPCVLSLVSRLIWLTVTFCILGLWTNWTTSGWGNGSINIHVMDGQPPPESPHTYHTHPQPWLFSCPWFRGFGVAGRNQAAINKVNVGKLMFSAAC